MTVSSTLRSVEAAIPGADFNAGIGSFANISSPTTIRNITRAEPSMTFDTSLPSPSKTTTILPLVTPTKSDATTTTRVDATTRVTATTALPSAASITTSISRMGGSASSSTSANAPPPRTLPTANAGSSTTSSSSPPSAEPSPPHRSFATITTIFSSSSSSTAISSTLSISKEVSRTFASPSPSTLPKTSTVDVPTSREPSTTSLATASGLSPALTTPTSAPSAAPATSPAGPAAEPVDTDLTRLRMVTTAPDPTAEPMGARRSTAGHTSTAESAQNGSAPETPQQSGGSTAPPPSRIGGKTDAVVVSGLCKPRCQGGGLGAALAVLATVATVIRMLC
ncbi:hypothetical protein GGTG_11809 [Gaeumannomyces tritici R3-111a-1]|uniref:Uncharacterized protein n=1 Tax=Gaeumannomyces tritici (strain R3-111a-1) TaxID=644352 RepID=J3PE86_GAET3|nr:hypothetical protein GGTG_11809 [Gaeumannomyces tritici R3-111a-1]EJT70786.1 hypothetical protein GGTG_11809 [Gaeumannomyces tritici R3-111a-1]